MNKLVPESHRALHAIAEEVTPEEFSDGSLKKLLKGMRQALKSYNVAGFTAVAIAAPQVGAAKRVFLVEDQNPGRDSIPTLVAVNPVIVRRSKQTALVGEGCLSVPDCYGEVKRHDKITLRALDEEGQTYQRGASGLLAQIIQHECDHLDGILFIDKAEKVIAQSEMDKLKAHEAETEESSQ